MDDRLKAQAAQDAAADALIRACRPRFPAEVLRNPATVQHLPVAPADFAELLEQLDEPPKRARTKH